MMSRPSDFKRLAFSATTIIALGLARPMRRASAGIANLVVSFGGTSVSIAAAGTAGRKREMLAQRTSSTRSDRPALRGFPHVFLLLLLALATLPGCKSTQVRQVEDAA